MGRRKYDSGIPQLFEEKEHWKERAERAEAAVQAEKELTTYWMERAVAAEDAPHTPEQAGDWANWPDTSHLGTAHVKQGPPEQAHGDALADYTVWAVEKAHRYENGQLVETYEHNPYLSVWDFRAVPESEVRNPTANGSPKGCS